MSFKTFSPTLSGFSLFLPSTAYSHGCKLMFSARGQEQVPTLVAKSCHTQLSQWWKRSVFNNIAQEKMPHNKMGTKSKAKPRGDIHLGAVPVPWPSALLAAPRTHVLLAALHPPSSPASSDQHQHLLLLHPTTLQQQLHPELRSSLTLLQDLHQEAPKTFSHQGLRMVSTLSWKNTRSHLSTQTHHTPSFA